MSEVTAIRRVMQDKWDTLAKPGSVVANKAKYADLDEEFWPIYDKVHSYTMTSVERLYDLYQSVRYVVEAGIPGDIIECGVWRGGSMMLVAHTLKQLGVSDRRLQLFDTFEGLPFPDSENDIDLIGNHASERWREGWIKVALEEVADNIQGVGYAGQIDLVQGMVEDTLRDGKVLPQYAIVRLDTDWEASTRVELEVLWPRLSIGGWLLVDDYGHWMGCRKACDDFFAVETVKLSRVDYSCRAVQKVVLR